jgi:ferredoxin-like protein FixX
MEANQDILTLIDNDMYQTSRNEMLRAYKLCGTECFKNLKNGKLRYDEEKCVETCFYTHFENRNIDKI